MHYTLSIDGYTLMQDEKKFYRYAGYSNDGDMVMSNVIANNPENRKVLETQYLQSIKPGIRYSEKQILQSRSKKASRMQGPNKFAGITAAFPSTGNRKLLVILVNFTDKSFVKTNANFAALYNTNTASFKNYYLATSYNKLNVTTTVVGPYTLSGSMATYGANDSEGDDINPRLMVQEAVDKAEAAGVNFAQFDNNGNGYVDGVQVIHAGYGEEAGASDDTIWSHQWSLGSSYYRYYDGVYINDYSTVPELYGASGSTMTGVGVLVHEFGHNIGCPDTYDTDYSDSGGQSFDVGDWDVMAGGSWNNSGNNPPYHNPYARWNLGWLTPTTISTTGSYTLKNAESNTTVYRIDTTTSNEYFLLENRQKTGTWDSYLPGHGMLIFHIDGNWISSHQSNDINVNPSHQGIDVEEADNVKTSASYSGDPFPGSGLKTSFTDSTTPNSKSWAGANTNKPISSIVESSGVITFSVTTGGSTTPKIKLSVSKLNFGAISGGVYTGTQTFRITNSGSGTLSWKVAKSASAAWLSFTPSSGTNTGQVSVSVSPSGLSTGTYSGTLTVTDSNASNSPQSIAVTLTVKKSSQMAYPFGDFATPTDLSTVMQSVPITGWALDDIGITSVKIYNGTSYVGDAVFIEGARPDVESSFSTYPFHNKSGWGYMLLTNFLPGGGNGWYTIYAKAYDKDGHEFGLGFKNIYCDNAHATRPFGAIDTPTQGGSAKGKEYINFGWVLTPKPKSIATNGSTITAYIDSVSIGTITYNQYREDIATNFPGYANSNGAVGFKSIDTSKYSDGVHTIHWIAYDNAGVDGGIGSRFFTIMNSSSRTDEENSVNAYQASSDLPDLYISQLDNIPVDSFTPTRIKKGFAIDADPIYANPDENGINCISIHEDEHVQITLNESENASNLRYTGYHLIGDKLKPLPIGSTFDPEKGILYWHPAAGFYGHYEFVFIASTDSGPLYRKTVYIDIQPKY